MIWLGISLLIVLISVIIILRHDSTPVFITTKINGHQTLKYKKITLIESKLEYREIKDSVTYTLIGKTNDGKKVLQFQQDGKIYVNCEIVFHTNAFIGGKNIGFEAVFDTNENSPFPAILN